MKKYKNKKQISIIITAKELFYKHGFKRVSVEEICQTAKVSKMTFYKYYPNKIELAKAVYANLIEGSISKFQDILHGNTSAEEKLQKLLMLKIESTNDISIEFVQDFYNDTELGLKEFIIDLNEKYQNTILKDFVYAQEKGWFNKDVDISLMFSISQKIMGLIDDPILLQKYESPQNIIIAITNLFTYGLGPRNK
ncbi:MAG: TetR/AcrR family transcriptional regulator [Bacteroidales bacterium]|nr:TetR/AcrR family transcriptional regulator [Bacteroidales bacterium]